MFSIEPPNFVFPEEQTPTYSYTEANISILEIRILIYVLKKKNVFQNLLVYAKLHYNRSNYKIRQYVEENKTIKKSN